MLLKAPENPRDPVAGSGSFPKALGLLFLPESFNYIVAEEATRRSQDGLAFSEESMLSFTSLPVVVSPAALLALALQPLGSRTAR